MKLVSTTPQAHRPVLLKLGNGQAFEVLDDCHQQIMGYLEKLHELSGHLENERTEVDVRALAQDIFDFFSTTSHEHHQDEERHIFPLLLQSADKDLVQAVLSLRQDHYWIEENWHELAPQLEAIAQGLGWCDPQELRHAIEVFAALYHDHIALEEAFVYPQAKLHMPTSVIEQMGREMAERRRQDPPRAN